MASPSGPRPPLSVAACPQVAELIDYAWNRLAGEAQQRIAAHLRNGGCRTCQSWLNRARMFPPPAVAADPAAGDSGLWQRQAFGDLEQRLRQLQDYAE